MQTFFTDNFGDIVCFSQENSGYKFRLQKPIQPLFRCRLFKAGLALALHGLKFNLLFQFRYFCTSVYFKTSGKKSLIDPHKTSEEIFPSL
jgi:hypothetical protein